MCVYVRVFVYLDAHACGVCVYYGVHACNICACVYDTVCIYGHRLGTAVFLLLLSYDFEAEYLTEYGTHIVLPNLPVMCLQICVTMPAFDVR